jgi:hypothetical protein
MEEVGAERSELVKMASTTRLAVVARLATIAIPPNTAPNEQLHRTQPCTFPFPANVP